MSTQFRILIVEDVAADAELEVREFRRAGIACDFRRVETAQEYRRELDEFNPHVILSDYSMPQFNGMDALDIARECYPDIPFIFVSGTVGEERAVRALKNGATDYVLKNDLLRLPAAVERARKEADERRERNVLEQRVRESQSALQEQAAGEAVLETRNVLRSIAAAREHGIISTAQIQAKGELERMKNDRAE